MKVPYLYHMTSRYARLNGMSGKDLFLYYQKCKLYCTPTACLQNVLYSMVCLEYRGVKKKKGIFSIQTCYKETQHQHCPAPWLWCNIGQPLRTFLSSLAGFLQPMKTIFFNPFTLISVYPKTTLTAQGDLHIIASPRGKLLVLHIKKRK